MNLSNTYKRVNTIRLAYYDWFHNTTWAVKLSMALGVALVTGIAAQVRIPLPYTPVPITAQVFTVLIAGILLGSWYGSLSMFLYLVIGFAGVPWFTNASPGLPLGPTSGYLIGFIPAALFIGTLSSRLCKTRRLLPLIGIMISAVGIIYVCGALFFALFMNTDIKQTLIMAVLPFIPFDIAKAFLAAWCASILLPSRD